MLDFNRRFNDNEVIWLVKVDTRISGPYSFNEVLAKLTSGEIQSHHEVMSPMDRWRSLVAQPLFAAAVEKLKRQIEIPTEYTVTKTERTSITRTLDLHSDLLTPTPFSNTITPPPAPNAGINPAAVYTGLPPRQARPKPSIWPLIGFVLIVVVAVGVYFSMGKKTRGEPQKQHSHFITFVDKGLESKKVADWYEALKNFKQAHQLNPRDVDLIYEMTPLLVQVESQTMYARSLMEKVMVGQYKKENIAQGANVVGLAYSYEGLAKPAVKQFENAIEADESYTPAMINKGFALILGGRYEEAQSILYQVITQDPESSIALLYLLEAYVIEGQKNNNPASFEKAYQLASQVAGRRVYDGMQEILLLYAYSALKTKKDLKLVMSILQRSLYIDPDMTTDHLHSPLIDWRGYNWKYFAFVCKDMTKVLKADLLAMLEFTCAYKMNYETGAQQAVDLMMNRLQNSSLPHVAQAIVAYRLGEYEKAKDSLSLAQKLGANDKLYYQVLIKLCGQTQDSKCLRQYADTVAKFAPLHAYTAHAIDGGPNSDERKLAVFNGLRESKNYLPLVKLQ